MSSLPYSLRCVSETNSQWCCRGMDALELTSRGPRGVLPGKHPLSLREKKSITPELLRFYVGFIQSVQKLYKSQYILENKKGGKKFKKKKKKKLVWFGFHMPFFSRPL